MVGEAEEQIVARELSKKLKRDVLTLDAKTTQAPGISGFLLRVSCGNSCNR